jgi:hypothetical protein
MSEEEHQPNAFAEAFQHVEYDSEAERGFLRRHTEVVEEEKAADERLLQEFHEATQHDFERGGMIYERPGEGDGTVTHRVDPNGSVPNQSEGHLSRIDREGYVSQLETRLASATNDTINDAIEPPFPVPADWAARLRSNLDEIEEDEFWEAIGEEEAIMDEDADYRLRIEHVRRVALAEFRPFRNDERSRIRAEVAARRSGQGRGARGGGAGHGGRGNGGTGHGGRGHDRRGRGRGGRGGVDGTADAGQDRGRVTLLNPINVQEMVDGQVDDAVYDKYLNEVMIFGDWVRNNQEDWLTEHGKIKYDELNAEIENEKSRQRRKRMKSSWKILMQKARDKPIFQIDKFTPKRFMEFIAIQANQFTGNALGRSGYGGKRSVFVFLVKLHNGRGHSQDFEDELSALWKGFLRKNTKRKTRRQPQEDDGNDDDSSDSESEIDSDEEQDDHEEFKEGKDPMSPELYRKVCKWLVEWGTLEGIFAALFIVMTWNLVCRGNNTAKVRFSHMSWNIFDAMGVNFRHTKTQQMGEAKRQKRNLYSNPFEECIDFTFLLGLYLATNFSSSQARGKKLFPGSSKSQSARVSALLRKVLKEHEAEVISMGYDSVNDIGLHSIRKGASSYLASLPGGPQPAAVCLRGGWSMGQIRDIYWHQMQAGDEFVGRCVSLLNMMNGDFAASPVFFDESMDEEWIKSTIGEVFPFFESAQGMQRILRMCLASLIHHREKVMAFDVNHVARGLSIYGDLAKLSPAVEKLKIVHAWDTHEHHSITGVPPHIKQLVDLEALKVEHSHLCENVCKQLMMELTKYFEVRHIGGGEITEARVTEMIAEACKQNAADLTSRIEEKVDALTRAFEESSGSGGREEVGQSHAAGRNTRQYFPLRATNDGRISRLPANFQFPKSTAYDLWVQWNVGNTERQIPALRSLEGSDFAFLDGIEKSAGEKRGQPGKHRDKRRASRKTYSDIKFLCNYIEKKGREAGATIDDRSLGNVRKTFEAAQKELHGSGKRKGQLKWRTLCLKIRKKLKSSGDNTAG